MQLSRTQPDENYPFLKFVSENGVWELGLTPMIFGVRVRAGKAGEGCVDVDYCAGPDGMFQLQLLAVIKTILEGLPEDITSAELCQMMPRYQRRPINTDPCWKKLQAMADKAEAQVA